MIEILPLFAGLVTGLQPFQLEVAEPVAAVEIRFDGHPAGTLTQAPWHFRIDLGGRLVPHEIVAVAEDGTGQELGRDREWINLEIGEPDPELTPMAITFDPPEKPTDRVAVPPVAELSSWFLDQNGEPLIVREVTAGAPEVVIVRDPTVQPLLENLSLLYLERGLYAREGAKPLKLDPDEWDPELLRLDKETFRGAGRGAFASLEGAPRSRSLGELWDAWNGFGRLGDETTIRFVSPLAAPVSQVSERRNVFLQTTSSEEIGLVWFMHLVRPVASALRFADAVAVSGLEAHAGQRPRAVVLLVDKAPADQSLYSVAQVRDYLRALQVPVFVWSFQPIDEILGWGEATFVGFETSRRKVNLGPRDLDEALERLETAITELRRTLETQRIVWVEGRHLPQTITLSDRATGARLAGGRTSDP